MNNEQRNDVIHSLIVKIPTIKRDGYQGGKITKKTTYLPLHLQEEFIKDVKTTDDVLVVDAIELVPLLLSKEINNVTYIDYGSECDVSKTIVEKLGCTYINVKNTKELQELQLMKQFDTILGNPPYNGQSKLHQKFFNKSVIEFLKEDGKLVFIQPSLPYLRHEKGADKDMMEQVLKHNVTVKMIDGNAIFDNAAFFYPLSITILCKDNSNTNVIDTYITKTGDISVNRDLETIHFIGTNPDVLFSMKDKVQNFITRNGSLKDVFVNKSDTDLVNACGIKRIGGHAIPVTEKNKNLFNIHGQYKDFFVITANNIKVANTTHPLKNVRTGIQCNENEKAEYVLDYIKTDFARFCLALTKINQHIDAKELSLIPKVDFNKTWTDEELFKLVGFTDREILEVRNTISPYYD